MPRSSGLPNAQANPFDNPAFQSMMAGGITGILIGLIGGAWSLVVFVIGLAAIQRISTGAAVGTIIISGIVSFIIAFGIMLIAGAAIVAMMAGSGGIH